MAKPPAVTPENQLALFEDQLAAMAMENVKAEQSTLGTAFLSTKSGVLTYRGNPVANNKLQCVIIAGPIERLYYDSRYDATKATPPKCFAIAVSATGMGPVASVEAPENATCEGCPKNEWGSSTSGGKGKACRETRRLLVIPADSIGSAAAVEAAEVAALRPPVTSLRNYATYIQTIAATLRRPTLGVITEIAVVPDAKTQFKVNFTMVKAIEDSAVLQALMKRGAIEATKAIESAGIQEGDEGEAAAPATQSTRF